MPVTDSTWRRTRWLTLAPMLVLGMSLHGQAAGVTLKGAAIGAGVGLLADGGSGAVKGALLGGGGAIQGDFAVYGGKL